MTLESSIGTIKSSVPHSLQQSEILEGPAPAEMDMPRPHPDLSIEKLRSLYIEQYDKAKAAASLDKEAKSVPSETGDKVFWILNIANYAMGGQGRTSIPQTQILFQGTSLADLEGALHRHIGGGHMGRMYDIYVNGTFMQAPIKAHSTCYPGEYVLDWTKLPLTEFYHPGNEINVQLANKDAALVLE